MVASTSARRRWARAVVSLLVTVAIAVAALPGPTAASSYEAAKIDPALLAQVLAAPTGDFDVIVRSSPAGLGRAPDRAGLALRRAGAKPKHALGIVGASSGRAKGVHVLKLTRDPEVAFVYADERIPALVGWTAGDLGPAEAAQTQAWPGTGRTGKGVGVAVIDSGVARHPDLEGRVVAAIDLLSTASVVSPTPLGDPGGHGTHVAGLIAGSGAASDGRYRGIAPEASIIDVRVIDANGNASLSNILRGLQWVLKERRTYAIRVANMSFGATQARPYTKDLLAAAAEVLHFAGVSVVAAAGNGGPSSQTIRTPAVDPFVIAVGVLDDAGTAESSDDTVAPFSSRGPAAFPGPAKPDVIAAGRRMVSLRADGSTLDLTYPDRRVSADGGEARYFRLSGSSMATAVTSGVLALMYEADPGMRPGTARTRLLRTARPLPGYAAVDQGHGAVDAFAAVTSTLAAEKVGRRPTDLFAQDTRSFLAGQPLVWIDLGFNGGVDGQGIPWANLTWENLTWENLTWENLTWENFTWENFTWENFTWENFTWENFTWENFTWETGMGSAWIVVD